MQQEHDQQPCSHKKDRQEARRDFLKQSSAMMALALTPPLVMKAARNDEVIAGFFEKKIFSIVAYNSLHYVQKNTIALFNLNPEL